jgi:hypothetical protein
LVKLYILRQRLTSGRSRGRQLQRYIYRSRAGVPTIYTGRVSATRSRGTCETKWATCVARPCPPLQLGPRHVPAFRTWTRRRRARPASSPRRTHVTATRLSRQALKPGLIKRRAPLREELTILWLPSKQRSNHLVMSVTKASQYTTGYAPSESQGMRPNIPEALVF